MSESTQIAPTHSWNGLIVTSKQDLDSRPVCERNHEVIQSMIAERKSSAEIADRVGCSAVLLNQYIRKIPDLHELRLKFRCPQKAIETSAWDKYQKRRKWVKKALKTRSMDAVG